MRYQFAQNLLDTRRRELLRNGRRIELERRALDLLIVLLERRGEEVSKDELLDALWPDTVTTDASLTRVVSLARAALDDRDREHPIIRTLYGRGYQIAVPVETCAPDPGGAEVVLGPEARAVFIGRGEVMAGLRNAVEGLHDGHGAAFLICGEAGIGKTSVVEQLREHATSRDALVLAGRCPDGAAATPYWPWTQALRGYTETRSPRSLQSILGSGANELAMLLPELADRSDAPASTRDAETRDSSARYRTFAALVELLGVVSSDQPLVVVLEDLHWADPPSLLSFAAAAQDLRHRPVLLVATCRTTEPIMPELGAALAEVRQRATAVDLQGFSRDEIERFVVETSGLRPSAASIDRLCEQTGGNPFFLTELVRVMRHGEAAGDLPVERPESVDDLVRRRVARLDEACRQAVQALAIIGKDAPLELMAAALGLEPGVDLAALLDALERARKAGIVAQRTAASGVVYHFIHDLIREVVREGGPAAERAAMHERVGNHLLAVHGTADPEALPRLAHHFCEAALLGDPTRAIDCSLLAAEQADGMYGWEEAAAHYRRALQLLERGGSDTAKQRVDVLVKLGRSLDLAGHADAESTFQRAATLAREHGDRDDFARVVLSFPLQLGGILWLEPIDEKRAQASRRLELIDEALERASGASAGQRALLLARSVLLDGRRSAPEVCRRTALESIEQARASGDSAVVATVLQLSVWSLWEHQTYSEARSSIDEAIDRLTRLGDRVGLLDALVARIMVARSWGDAPTARADIATYARVARSEHHKRHQWHALLHEAVASLLEFDCGRAEALMQEALALAQRLDTVDETLGMYSGVLREQGRLGEFVAVVDERQETTSEEEMRWRLALGYILAEIGETERANALLDGLGHPLPLFPVDEHREDSGICGWPFGLALAADAASLLHRRDDAARLYDAIRGWRGRNAFGPAMTPHFGPFDLRMGNLALLQGQYQRAVEHIEDAIELATRSQEPLHVTHCRAALVNALRHRADANDLERARKLESEVRAVYAAHEMEHWSGRMIAVRPRLVRTG